MDKSLEDLPKMISGEDRSGTTVTAALITPKKIFLINCGDSRGFLVRSNRIEMATFDHKPTNLKERQRIQNAGGIVKMQRVNGGLATSRGLGDFEYKRVPGLSVYQQYVIGVPDVFSIDRSLDKDDFIVLACDGIWDVAENDYVREFIASRLKTHNLVSICNQLLDNCLERVIFFKF
jgi:serine/threonine protein phosphatase PrpC